MKKIFLFIFIMVISACSQHSEEKKSKFIWDCSALSAEWQKWSFAGGKELKGLKERRRAEIKPCYNQ